MTRDVQIYDCNKYYNHKNYQFYFVNIYLSASIVGSQSAASIYENTALWLAVAKSGTRTPSRSISIYSGYIKAFTI